MKKKGHRDKKFEFASTGRICEFLEIASDFMFEVFDLIPGEYLITDESKLTDFTEFGSSDTSSIWATIEQVYGFTRSHVGSEYLVDVFLEIRMRRKAH